MSSPLAKPGFVVSISSVPEVQGNRSRCTSILLVSSQQLFGSIVLYRILLTPSRPVGRRRAAQRRECPHLVSHCSDPVRSLSLALLQSQSGPYNKQGRARCGPPRMTVLETLPNFWPLSVSHFTCHNSIASCRRRILSTIYTYSASLYYPSQKGPSLRQSKQVGEGQEPLLCMHAKRAESRAPLRMVDSPDLGHRFAQIGHFWSSLGPSSLRTC